METVFCEVVFEGRSYVLRVGVGENGESDPSETVPLGTRMDEAVEIADKKVQRFASRSGRKHIIRYYTRSGELERGATFNPKRK